MTININDEFGARSTPATAGHPLGSTLNDTAGQPGTPLNKLFMDDLIGAHQALLAAAGITASGNVDQVGSSDVVDAIIALIQQNSFSLANGNIETDFLTWTFEPMYGGPAWVPATSVGS